jgi:protein-S-isoprenylcysteine O-methyltransferase Ste14
MNANTSVGEPNGPSDMSHAIVRRMIQVVVQFLLLAAILFISSGRLDWVWTWAYLGVGVGILFINLLVLPPELIAERGRRREDVKRWDRVLTTLSIFPTLGALVVAGLDVRFGWSPALPVAIHLVALAFMALGQGLFTWAMTSNLFFSTAVSIQKDRAHAVATGGPYRYVRHPGYVGYSVSILGTPVIIGSLWGLIPAVLTACLLVVRTALEDRTLLEELAGYQDYARQVRYRLVPGVW